MEEFVELLQQAKFIQKRVSMEIYNTNSNNFSIVKAIIVAGLYPNVCFIKRPPGSLSTDYHLLPFTINKTSNSATEDRVFFHPSSYLAGRSIPKKFQWLVFHSKVRSSRVFIRDSTLVLPYAFLLFGGPITVFHDKQQIQVGEWILFQAAAKTGVVFKQLRLILDQVLQKKITNPQLNLMEASKPLMETVIYLFQNEEKELELV